MVRRAIALVAMGLCACNAIIGLDQPTFVGPEDDGATSPPTLDAGGAEDGASQGGAPEDGTAPDARDASLAASDATDATPAGDATDATLLDGRAPPPDDSGSTTSDAGLADTSTGSQEDGGVAAEDPNPRVILVNGSRLPTVSFCVGLGQASDGSDTVISDVLPYPLSGLAAGAGTASPDISNLSTSVLTIFVLPEAKPTAPCNGLLGAGGEGGLVASSGFYRLPSIAAGTLLENTTSVLALVGCPPESDFDGGSVAVCGASYDPVAGNIAAIVATTTTPVSGPGASVQAVYAAPALDCLTACGTPVTLGLYVPGGPDASSSPIRTLTLGADTLFEDTYSVTPPLTQAILSTTVEDGAVEQWQWTFGPNLWSSPNWPGSVVVVVGDPTVAEAPPFALNLLTFPLNLEAGTPTP